MVSSWSDTEKAKCAELVFTAKQVIAGSDVTTTKPQGPVIINSGKTSIIGASITLKNDFEVRTGGELYIGNE